MEPYLPRPVSLGWRTFGEWFLATFRCQTYWLLATRAAWRVLWQTARFGRYEPTKTDRVVREVREAGGLPAGSAGVADPTRLGVVVGEPLLRRRLETPRV